MPVVFAGNLPRGYRKDEILKFLSKYPPDEISLKSGYAFLTYFDKADAEDVIERYHGEWFGGSRVTIEMQRKKGGSRRERSYGHSPRYPQRPQRRIKGKYYAVIVDIPSECSWQDLKDFAREFGAPRPISTEVVRREGTRTGLLAFRSLHDMEDAVDALDGQKVRPGRGAPHSYKPAVVHAFPEIARSGSRSQSSRGSLSRSRSRSRHISRRSRSRSQYRRSRSASPYRRGRSLSRSVHRRRHSRSRSHYRYHKDRSRSSYRKRSRSKSYRRKQSRSKSPRRRDHKRSKKDRTHSSHAHKVERRSKSKSQRRSKSKSLVSRKDRSRSKTDCKSRSKSKDWPNSMHNKDEIQSIKESPTNSQLEEGTSFKSNVKSGGDLRVSNAIVSPEQDENQEKGFKEQPEKDGMAQDRSL